jgi:ATP-dependent Clp protease ATP-binding subunit ClpA
MDLIQKGLVDKDKPAAIFLFVGLSGTGKTELAKQIAQVYSNSRKLITFAMADFPEAHSVSGLIGSPAGYVGYEEGGKLIKDLNRDPYSVVLLDEVEKAHPAIWDPFLNLFDEGIITDRRGVTAYGNKAFFVMTSNIGQYQIVDMLKQNSSMEQIVEVVKRELNNAKSTLQGAGGQKCFRPEFFGRILPRGGIVVFNPLSLEALEGIARHKINGIIKNHENIFENSRLEIASEVTSFIAKIAFEKNETAITNRDAYVGGRNLGELLDYYINKKLSADIRKISKAPLVRIVMDGNDSLLIPIYNQDDADDFMAKKRQDLKDRVSSRFDLLVNVPSEVFDGMSDNKLSALDMLLSEVNVNLGAT